MTVIIVMASIKPVVGKKVDAITFHVLQLLLDHFRVGPLVEALEGRVWLFVQIGAFVWIFRIVNPSLRAPDIGVIDKGTVFLALQTSPKYISGVFSGASIPRRHKKDAHLLAGFPSRSGISLRLHPERGISLLVGSYRRVTFHNSRILHHR